jgi:molybdopterin molybdotransferase
MVPQGADTIVMQENTQPIPATATNPIPRVAILQVPEPQAFVRRQGAYYQAGTPLLNPGIALSAPDIAVLAAMQCAQASVYRRLRVAIFSTGDELVSIDQPLQPGQIVDSNQYALATLVQQMGAEPILLGIVPDDSQALKAAMTHAIQQADVVLSSGGVSVGDYDYVDQLLKDLGATLHIRSIAVKPGKPLTVATVPPGGDVQIDRPVLYFGLPGNPVSALVSFWRFVQPALKKMAGLSQGYGAEFIEGITQQDLRAGGTRETYLWGHCHWHQDGHHDEQNGACQFSLAGGSHSSGNLINLAQTNALAMVPVGTKLVRAGDRVKILRV